MNYHVTLTGDYAKGANPKTPLFVLRAQIIRNVMRNAADPKHPWEVRVADQKWARS